MGRKSLVLHDTDLRFWRNNEVKLVAVTLQAFVRLPSEGTAGYRTVRQIEKD